MKIKLTFLILLVMISCNRITIDEPEAYVHLDCAEVQFDQEGGTKTISFSSSAKPFATPWKDWVSASITKYENPDGVVTISVGPNEENSIKTTKVTIKCGQAYELIVITQKGKPIKQPEDNENDNDNEDTNNDTDGPSALSITLPETQEFKSFANETLAIPFTVTENSDETLTLSQINEWSNCNFEYELSEDKKTGLIILMPSAFPAYGEIKISNRNTNVYYRFTINEYNLTQTGDKNLVFPTEGGYVTATFNTDIPEEYLDFKVEPELFTVTDVNFIDGEITLLSAENITPKDNVAVLTVFETSDRISPITWTLAQGVENKAIEGCVWFEDLNFKNAVVEDYDRDSDYEISYAEAEQIYDLDVSGLGITSMTGIEHMPNLRSIDISGNNLNKDIAVDLSGNHIHLKDIKCDDIISLDIRGCRLIMNLRNANDEPAFLHSIRMTENQYIKNYSAVFTTTDKDERTSSDLSLHGTEKVLQTHTKGKGYEITLVGFDYLDIDHESGLYEEIMMETYESLFYLEPMKSFKEYFDVKIKYNVYESRHEEYTIYTADYAKSLGVVVCILPFEGRSYAGRGHPADVILFYNYNDDYKSLVQHEVVGHCIADLTDEYVEPDGSKYDKKNPDKQDPCDNVSKSNDPLKVPWAKLLAHPDYKDITGIYEGAACINKGFYRSTENSIMNHRSLDTGKEFNAISRFFIFKNIIYDIGEKRKPDNSIYTLDEMWDEFFEYDKINL